MLCLAAYAKINWTLDILGVRPDGYHLMDMLMQTVSLCDLLWMEEAEDLTLEAVPGGADGASRPEAGDGLSSEGVRYDASNLVCRAARLLRERFGVRDVVINYVDPVIGAHSGPGTMALFYMAESRN